MKVGFIGAGKMAEAIIAALIRSDDVGAHEIFASDVSEGRRTQLKREYGINVYSSNSAVVASADILVLAVKPQILEDVLREIGPELDKDDLLISIAAGKRMGTIEALAGEARVIRVMPNLPATVGAGMSVFCIGRTATPADSDTARKLLESFGRVLELPEEALDAVTAVSGSGPAFFAYVAEQVVAGGVALGLERSDAELLAVQTMLGTARLLLDGKKSPTELIQAVSSPNGTTVAGMAVLEGSELSALIQATLAAAARRSRELSA